MLTASALAEDDVQALNFDGDGDYVDCGGAEAINLPGPLTLEVWIRPAGWGENPVSGFGRIIDKGFFRLFLNQSGSDFNDRSLVFFLDHPAGQSAHATPPDSIALDSWLHVAATYDGEDDVRLFLNGETVAVSQNLGPPLGPITDTSWASFRIGNSQDLNRAFEGAIRDVRIWDRVRSTSEIATNRDVTLAGDEAGLIGYWPIDEGTGETVSDRSGSGNAGTIFGATWAISPPVDDRDDDGLPDAEDGCPDDPAKFSPGECGCGVPDDDTDGDGTADCADGCPDDSSKQAPGICGCGASDVDGDGDGVPDCADGCPDNPGKLDPGICGCAASDNDGDGDGTPDCRDGCPSDPQKTTPGICGCDASDDDRDGDGTPDCRDDCPFNPEKTAPGLCGCDTPDADMDGDGTPDCADQCPEDGVKAEPGLCGCGAPDVDEDGDGAADCRDQCPDDPAKFAPGACGCGVSDVDGDNDGIPDCQDGCPENPERIMPGLCGCAEDADRNLALRFNGDDAAVDFGNPEALNLTGPLTLEAWIRPTGWGAAPPGGFGRIFDKSAFLLFLNNRGTDFPDQSLVFFMTDAAGTGTAHPAPAGAMTLNQWQHVAVSVDEDRNIRIFIDGESREIVQPSGPPAAPIANNGPSPLFVGNNPAFARGFEGDISNLRVWSVARTAEDIRETMNTGLSDDESGLVGYWPMCDAGETVRDLSGNGNNGRRIGAEWVEGPGAGDDRDGDGVTNLEDGCPDDPAKTAPGSCGCGTADTDRDGDGTPDCTDECPDDPTKTDPGVCGCGVPETDADGDGVEDCVDENLPPERPNLRWPLDGLSFITQTPELRTSSFADPDGGDTHLKTRWRIALDADFTNGLLDRTSDRHLEILPVPSLLLAENTTYFWRVRHIDAGGETSPWSETFAFTTNALPSPPNGDAPPAEEANGQTASIAPSTGVRDILATLSISPEVVPDTANRPAHLPLGLFAIKLATVLPGDFGQVIISADAIFPADARWHQYDPFAGWLVYTGANVQAGNGGIVLRFRDGGIGDEDGVTNGIILHRGGPDAVEPPQTTGPEEENVASGGNGGGGCWLRSLVNLR